MSVNVDARGLACPQPVIATKRALDSMTEGLVTVIVDNVVAKENVIKFAFANNCAASVTENSGHFTITITKGAAVQQSIATEPAWGEATGSHVFLITRNTLGQGSDELGAVLMKSFFFTMVESEPLPKALLFLNSGVKLTVNDSPVLDHLRVLADRGVEVISCGTCLDYFNLKDYLAVGSISNMYTIMDTITVHKAITI